MIEAYLEGVHIRLVLQVGPPVEAALQKRFLFDLEDGQLFGWLQVGLTFGEVLVPSVALAFDHPHVGTPVVDSPLLSIGLPDGADKGRFPRRRL
jgi:hypothetical protein